MPPPSSHCEHSRGIRAVFYPWPGRATAEPWHRAAKGTVRLGPQTGDTKQLRSKLTRPVQALAISGDGKFLAAAVENVIYTWGTDLALTPKQLRGHRLYVSGLAFLHGRHELVSFGTDKFVRFWDLDTDRQNPSLPAPTGHCHGLALSSDGKLLACIGGGKAQLYDLEHRRPRTIGPMPVPLMASFSPDKKLLAVDRKARFSFGIPAPKRNWHNYTYAIP